MTELQRPAKTGVMVASCFSPSDAARDGERIARRMARAGLCSRREAERWIMAGRVAVNGIVLTSPAVVITPGQTVTVDGVPVAPPAPARLWRYHKPRGLVTTNHDPQNRPTVFDALPKDLPRVMAVGRLDINTEGLLLLTNDGALARALEHPASGLKRRYRVRAFGAVTQKALDALKEGGQVDGMTFGPVEARLDRAQGANLWLTVTLAEGKNREIKRLLDSLGLQVNRLIRVAYGRYRLDRLAPGALAAIPGRAIKSPVTPAKPKSPKTNPGPCA